MFTKLKINSYNFKLNINYMIFFLTLTFNLKHKFPITYLINYNTYN